MPSKVFVREVARRSGRKGDSGDERERVWLVWRADLLTGRLIEIETSEVWDALEGIVEIGDVYSNSAQGLQCYDIDISEDEESLQWEVSASYKIPDQEQQPDSFEEFIRRSGGNGEKDADNPENPFGPEFSGGAQVIEEYSWRDIKGKPFINVVGSAFQNVPAIPVTIQVDRVTVSQAAKPDTSRQGICSGRYLLAGISYQYAEHVDRKSGKRTRYYRNTYERWAHPYRDWSSVELLQMGFMELKNGEAVNIMVKDAQTGRQVPVSEPRPLDANGKALPPGHQPARSFFVIRHEVASLNIPFLG